MRNMIKRKFFLGLISVFFLCLIMGCGGPPKDYTVAEDAYQNEEYHQSIELFQKFVDENPENSFVDKAKERMVNCYYKIGSTHENDGKIGDALLTYRKALNLLPDNDLLKDKIANVYLKQGELLLQTGYYQPAIDYVQQAFEFGTANPKLKDLIADAYFMQTQERIKIDRLTSAKECLSNATKVAANPLKKEHYEKVLVAKANEHLHRKNYYSSYLYFSLLEVMDNNVEYRNLAEYALAQLKPHIEFYPEKKPVAAFPNPLFGDSDSRYYAGMVLNISKRGFLTEVKANVVIYAENSDKPTVKMDRINLLENRIGFPAPIEGSLKKTTFPLEPQGDDCRVSIRDGAGFF
ncbi:MAG: hypothetical protein B6244_13375 [Candidatus Cloacimonetes bacterium 4572_55]|nr:MAG: hypothetical protein B6244_13375 [Candidatus Cloacimonetes bacterium 4572_55]